MQRPKINLDALNNAPPKEVAEASFEIIDRLQHRHSTPHIQAAAVCAAFLVLCHRLRIEAQDVFTATGNMMADEREGGRAEFQALKLYVDNEIAK